jgi:phage FluMu gp28-like protein
MATPTDVIRVIPLDSPELPAQVREIPEEGFDPLAAGVLMLHQREWIKQIHEYDLNIAEKGRRTGITYATALDDSITAASNKKAGGDNVYYIGDTKEKGLEFIGYVAKMAKIMAMAMAEGWNGIEVFLFEDQQDDGSSKHITSYRIRFASGFQVVALSSNPANIRGLQGIVNIDEAAFHKSVQAVIDACTALLIWGGKIRIISTHNGMKNPFNQLIRDARAGDNAFKVFHCTFDDAVKNGLYKRVCLMKGWPWSAEAEQKWYDKIRKGYGTNTAAMKEELDAIPREGSGVAIPGVLIERAMKEVRPIARLALDTEFTLKPLDYRDSWIREWIKINIDPLLQLLDKERQHFFGSDYARHADFAVFGPMTIEQDLRRKVPFLVEMHNVPTRHQTQIIWYIIDRLPRFVSGAMDATGNGSTLAEYTAERFGLERIFQVKLNDAWYRENMVRFQKAFEDDEMDIPKDADVLNDVRALEFIDGIIKLPNLRTADTKDAAFKRHGDSAITLALGHFATRQEGITVFACHAINATTTKDLPRPIKTTAGFGRTKGAW